MFLGFAGLYARNAKYIGIARRARAKKIIATRNFLWHAGKWAEIRPIHPIAGVAPLAARIVRIRLATLDAEQELRRHEHPRQRRAEPRVVVAEGLG
ncbi:MAG: hypothetical protein OXI87_22240, partial [Albidovulum sp.]|nr:hypothetical protein [Albidovulum sp.]